MPTAQEAKTEPIRFLANTARIQVDGSTTGGVYAVVELTGPRGDMPPLHVHHREDEAFYLLDGHMTVFVGDLTIELEAGDCTFAPRGIPHVYRVESEEARWLALASPAGFERFVGEVAGAGESVEPAELTEISSRYGIEILGPPGTMPA